jgi:peptide/nickel transport system permease protein
LVLTPYMLRMVRTNVREVLDQPLVRSAVLRGVPNRTVVWRHVVPNAALPVINVVALTLADIVAGVVVVETVFAFPGVGKLFVDSVLAKDVPTVQAVALVVGLGFVTLNLLADLLRVAVDPRLRSRAGAPSPTSPRSRSSRAGGSARCAPCGNRSRARSGSRSCSSSRSS